MKLQVLVSTMNQNDINSLVEKMNIRSDAIIINQCDHNSFEEYSINGNTIKLYSFAERGIGLSRNNALMRVTADICLFADDDVTYVDDYSDLILSSFRNNPNADFIIFNVPSTNDERPSDLINKYKRIRFYNCLRYGTFMMAVRTEKIRKANIYFSLLFGGGAKFGSGEDSLFITDCIRNGLRVYADPKIIGYVSHNESTWFKGYTDKYFLDKGALFKSITNRWAKLMCIQYAIRHRKLYRKEKSFLDSLKLMLQGIKYV